MTIHARKAGVWSNVWLDWDATHLRSLPDDMKALFYPPPPRDLVAHAPTFLREKYPEADYGERYRHVWVSSRKRQA